MKKFGIVLMATGAFFVICSLGFVQYKKADVKKSVLAYLTTEGNINQLDIVSTEPFISNVSGDKNWMVSVRLKDDNNTYYYYKNNKNKIILESFNSKNK